jgi:hypothetical protein
MNHGPAARSNRRAPAPTRSTDVDNVGGSRGRIAQGGRAQRRRRHRIDWHCGNDRDCKNGNCEFFHCLSSVG